MAKRDIPTLIVESAPPTVEFQFLSLIEYGDKTFLCVIDNMVDNMVYAYVLDGAMQHQVNLESLIPVINNWSKNPTEPISFLFARLGISKFTANLYRSFEVTGITRLVGNCYKFGVAPVSKIRRRKIVEYKSPNVVKLTEL